MRWKHYFYFTRGERLAIIALLLLIVIVSGFYIYIRSTNQTLTQEIPHNPEFEKFIAQLKHKEEVERVVQPQKEHNGKIYQRYPYQPKLKKGERIELNSADTSSLKLIPKIGSGYANRIVKYRNLLGGYISLEQLKEVWGMDDYLYADILPFIELTNKHQRIRINHVDFKQLNKHPYIDYKQAQIIMDIRERKGNIESIERLALLEEFNEKDIARLRPYLSFD